MSECPWWSWEQFELIATHPSSSLQSELFLSSTFHTEIRLQAISVPKTSPRWKTSLSQFCPWFWSLDFCVTQELPTSDWYCVYHGDSILPYLFIKRFECLFQFWPNVWDKIQWLAKVSLQVIFIWKAIPSVLVNKIKYISCSIQYIIEF